MNSGPFPSIVAPFVGPAQRRVYWPVAEFVLRNVATAVNLVTAWFLVGLLLGVSGLQPHLGVYVANGTLGNASGT